MPHACSAWACTNRCTLQTRSRGIAFYRFPTDIHLRKQWEVALRRECFSANDSSRLCSEHFRQEDFHRTGQTVRIRDGALPSVFRFPTHLQRVVATRTTLTSVRAQESLSVHCSLPVQEIEALPDPSVMKDLREKNLINEELKERLDLYSGKIEIKYKIWRKWYVVKCKIL
ncbi:THAP domain-containing protein 6-like [Erpetoichthys calabaricus]|uniref:THAP domain-containing protein 6-like n=1 Tax=Erpetoichthys calabaricus TaxID=27687 RepID=UPI0022347BAB|nr:THAP domain-containing protein 6-like [Erpetoichthys calabaricus]